MTLDFTPAARTITTMIRSFGFFALSVFLILLALATLAFVDHALRLGWTGLKGTATDSRLISDVAAANIGIFIHMLTGALITILAPIQLIPAIRRRFPRVHRWSGRVLVGCATITACGGLSYILLHGTIGGPHMSVAFAIYGALMLICAGQTIRYARAREWSAHGDWALRLFFLAIASWLYRVHYGIWVPLTDRAGMARDFSGWFDQINLWAFYVPYLVILELTLLARGRGLIGLRHRQP